jgi:molecular chaperone DnaK
LSYHVGIDLGTTYTAAAVFRDGRATIFSLGDRSAAIPSVVFLREDETILTGDAAVRRAVTEPERVAREFKRRLGDTTPIIVGGSPYSAEALMARLLRFVLDDVAAGEGGEPDRVAVSHPANWGEYKHDLLRQALQLADLDPANVTLLTEPEAAAISYATQERVDPGEVLAIYDLGGGTFDAAVLRRTDAGFEIIGKPEGIERLGGIDFDAAVFAHVVRALDGVIEELDHDDPTTISAVARLRQDCVDAKEALSSDTDATIPVLLPGLQTEVRITRGEFEGLIRPSLVDSIEALRRALRSAGVGPDDVSKVLLVGGSSRVPLISQMVSSELGRPVAVDAHPKHAIALGASIAAAQGDSTAAAPPIPAPLTPAPSPAAPSPAAPSPAAPPTPPPAPPAATAAPQAVAPQPAMPPQAAAPVTPPTPHTVVPDPAPTPGPDPTPTSVGDGPMSAPGAPAATPAIPVVPTNMPASSVPATVAPAVAEPLAASTSGSSGSRAPLLAAIGAVVLVVLGVGGYLLSRGGGTDDASTSTTQFEAAGDEASEAEEETPSTTEVPEAETSTSAVGALRTDIEILADVTAAIRAFGEGVTAELDGSTVELVGNLNSDSELADLEEAAGSVDGIETVNTDGLTVLPESAQCSDLIMSQPRWVCITSVTFDGTKLTAGFISENGGSVFNAGGGFHVHFFDGDQSDPVTAGLSGDASTGGGNWQVWDLTPVYESVKWADTDIQVICGRVATSSHTLESLDSGNCFPVTRS